VGWVTDLSEGIDSTNCKAPDEYVGPCSKTYDFHLLNTFARAEWEIECHAYWPCVT
jgi:CPW-WPC domain-containing protein